MNQIHLGDRLRAVYLTGSTTLRVIAAVTFKFQLEWAMSIRFVNIMNAMTRGNRDNI